MEATITNTAVNTTAAQNAINANFAMDLEKFASITGAEVTVSDSTAEQAQQALRDLQVASRGESNGYYDVRAQFMSDGTGPAQPIAFEKLIGKPGIGELEKTWTH